MKKYCVCFTVFCLILSIGIHIASAQDAPKKESDTVSRAMNSGEIGEIFTKAVYREQFQTPSKAQYARFAKDIWYFDNLGLSYFPSEYVSSLEWEHIDNPYYNWYFHELSHLDRKDWGLVMRENTGKVFKQMIYLDEPSEKDVFHGLDFPKVTYLEDFYFYTDLFITDSYPEGTGSVYVYFSNSMLVGNRTSYGILIDPRDGIYRAVNNYDSFSTVENKSAYSNLYLLGSEKHYLDLIERLDPSLYEGKTGSIGNDLFPAENIDRKFAEKLDAVKQTAAKDGTSDDPAVYRMELIRLNGRTNLYINGVFVTDFEDDIRTDGLSFVSVRNGDDPIFRISDQEIDLTTVTDILEIEDFVIRRFDEETWTIFNPKNVTEMVSWTIGPRLYAGGEMMTAAAGNVIIYGTN